MEDLILITGATGYVGGELLRAYEKKNIRLRCMLRAPKKIKHFVRHTTECVFGDVLNEESLNEALKGVSVAYYLIHSMKLEPDFVEADRLAAINFARTASLAKVDRIIYLGGLSQKDNTLSDHMKSRLEVGDLLREHAKGVTVIEFRASIIIGSGSLSFEMIRALTERLPIMVMPKWVSVKSQPIAIDDVLDYLFLAKDFVVEGNPIFEIGGKDCVSYREIMEEYGRQRGLNRLMISVPVLTPYLSSLWLGLFTPLFAKVGKKLIESICCESIVKDNLAKDRFGLNPVGINEAIDRALKQEDREYSSTKCLDAKTEDELKRRFGGVLIQGRIFDTRCAYLDISAEKAFAAIEQIGGSNGWYYGDWLWRFRGALDTFFGGVGMRRGRAHPLHLKEGDILDFWRVEKLEKNKRLRLRAEMKVPGRAWLEFLVEPQHKKIKIRQTAIYDPLGVLGLLYWYLLYPIHQFVFKGMLRGISQVSMGQNFNDITFRKKSHLPVSAFEAFQWHKNPGALERLTPPWQKIEILEKQEGLYDGSLVKIEMKIGPFKKIWIARHYNYIEGKRFCDEQIEGPFVKWQHEHLFSSKTAKTSLLEDNITYRLPFGRVGQWIGSRWVRRELERVFHYRHTVTALDLKHWKEMNTMKILISGSSGLVGQALVPCLLAAQHQVISLVRSAERVSDCSLLWNPNLGFINPSELEGFDAVINLSGENIAIGRWTKEKKRRILESRVKTTQLLADTLAHLKSPPRVWINASAVGYYGDFGDEILSEESPVGDGFLARVCEKWENATYVAKERGIRVINARFGVILSLKGGLLKRVLPSFKLGLGGMIGDGGQYMSWIAMDDLLGVFAHILKNETVEGPINVVSPYPVSNFEFTKILGKVLHRPTVLPLPAFLAKLIFGKEMANEMLLSSTRVLPKKLLESGYVFHYPKLDKALGNILN